MDRDELRRRRPQQPAPEAMARGMEPLTDPMRMPAQPPMGAERGLGISASDLTPRISDTTTAPLSSGASDSEMTYVGIGEKQIIKAMETLTKYKGGKARLERRVIASEDWWKMRNWDYMAEDGNPFDDHHPTAWLFNVLLSKHADGIEAYPEPNILPREPGDKAQAKMLSSIVPVVLQQNDFEETYSRALWQKLKQGTGIYGVFWDKDKLNGLGDISVRQMDVLNIYWEPGITDIQRSRNVFTTELVDRDLLREMYPGKVSERPITGKSFEPAKYRYDDNVDTTGKCVVVDWYYHKRVNGKNTLQYCKFVDDVVLFATENEPSMAERGLYDHGLYPFVFDPLFPVEGSPCGHSYIDVGKNAQEDIDRMNQAMVKNTLMAANPRYFIRGDGSVNEAEFADWRRPLVHVTNGQLGDDSLKQIDVNPLGGIYAQVLMSKIDELKETTGNRDVSNGGSTSGVTAASGIAAMMEQSGKTSRASTRSAYRAYAEIINLVIELIRQFYDLPRKFRILGDQNMEQFVEFDNSGILPQYQGVEMGQDMGYRLPVFDVEVSAQKMNAYTKVSQNELALQLFQLGILDPANSDKALALLEIMDFNHKDLIEEKVRQNGTLYQALAMYQQIAMQLAQEAGRPDVMEQIAANVMGTQAQPGAGMAARADAQKAKLSQNQGASPADPNSVHKANPITDKATQRAQASSQPQ